MTSREYNRPPKVALVHDFLLAPGGAERVLVELHRLYPDAPVYTLLASERVVRALLPGADIRTSFLQKWPAFLRRRYALLLPFFPIAVERIDLRDFDLIISSSGAWSKGLVTRLRTRHLAYLHSPMRFAWEDPERYLRERGLGGLRLAIGRIVMSYLRVWDFQAADRPDVLLANSTYTQARVAKYYRKEAEVVYPPVAPLLEVKPQERSHFLVVARLTRSKKIEPVVQAFSKLGLPLAIAGDGPEKARLQKQASDNVRFLGAVTDEQLAQLYAGARALILPSEEDFGLVAAEALAAGVPVIAYGRGGVREIVQEGQTGIFFERQTPEVIAAAVWRFLRGEREGHAFSSATLLAAGKRFSPEAFREGIREAVDRLLKTDV